MPELEILIVFPTTHMTLSAEKSLEDENIRYRTVMKPRAISSDCGLAIRIDGESVEECRKRFVEDSLLPAGFFRKTGDRWECVERFEK